MRRYHEAQLTEPYSVTTSTGVVCERITRPVPAVGLYVPAGTAPLPSTAIMLAVPAALAGCPVRILCTPPRPDGTADPAVLTAAAECGVTEVYKIGGAQAVAAMAYGTESVPKVDKIFGPGNAWVTAAKTEVAADPAGAALDMPAGPSEVLVIADAAADPRAVALDLLSQAEHGEDSQVILVTTSEQLADAADAEIAAALPDLPRRPIMEQSLAHSRTLLVADMDEALEVSNTYAPEHLIMQVDSARDYLDRVTNAGSIFLGPYTPESVGDYCSGTNHVLPTYGYARAYSGLSLADFQKRMSVQELTADGVRGLQPTVSTLARLEGLDAHARAVEVRVERLDDDATAGRQRMSSVIDLARPEIRKLVPYEAAKYADGLVRLNANETPWPAPGSPAAADLNHYPPEKPEALRDALAAYYGVDSDQTLVTRGSSEAIDLLIRCFCRAGEDAVVVCPPTFGMYRVYAEIQGARVHEVPLQADNGYELDADELVRNWPDDGRVLFLCSPNNPTGNRVATEQIDLIARLLSGRALVVVDAAYTEFADEDPTHAMLNSNGIQQRRRTAHAVQGLRAGRRALRSTDRTGGPGSHGQLRDAALLDRQTRHRGGHDDA